MMLRRRKRDSASAFGRAVGRFAPALLAKEVEAMTERTSACSLVLALGVLSGLSAWGQWPRSVRKGACYEKATSQRDLNRCAASDWEIAEKKMKNLLDSLSRENSDDVQFVEALRKSQDAWIAYRDAQLKAMYPEPNTFGAYGSSYPMCRSMYLTYLVEERVRVLERMFHEEDDGDICSGGHSASKENRSK